MRQIPRMGSMATNDGVHTSHLHLTAKIKNQRQMLNVNEVITYFCDVPQLKLESIPACSPIACGSVASKMADAGKFGGHLEYITWT